MIAGETLRTLAPELVLAVTAFAALFAPLRSPRAGWIALAGLCAVALLLCARAEGATVLASIEADRFAAFFQLAMTAASAVVVAAWLFAQREVREIAPRACFLLLAALLGGFVMVGTHHALPLVLGSEMLSLACIALAGFDEQRTTSSEAALKLLVSSGLATALSIYGLGLLYGLGGSLDFEHLGDATSAGFAARFASDPWPISIALTLVLCGVASKIALAPLAFLAPDVGEGAPTPAAAFFVVVAKLAGFGALLRILAALFVRDDVARAMQPHAQHFGARLAVLAAVTLAIGSLAALRQAGLKRLLANSSIAHTGIAAIGVACLDETGFAAALVFLAYSTLAHAGAFVAVVFAEGATGSDRLEDLRGLGRRSPLLAIALLVQFASLSALPPSPGFHAQFRVLLEAWNAGFAWLVLLAAGAMLLWLSLFLRIANELFREPSATRERSGSRVLQGLAVALALATLILGVWPGRLERWAASALDLLR
ncbi:MAG TPA: proton-conducting transporter membrane subunit [Planctomycetota bacterium]|nr:proton-conducting transporter membrane subunit [Planctomycetota bacterium]